MTTSTAPPRPDPVRAILLAAADLLEQDGAWCQHAHARDAEGYATHPRAAEAMSWCPIGAIDRIAHEANGETSHSAEAQKRLTKTLVREGYLGTVYWNDIRQRTQANVVAMLRRVAGEET